MRLSIITINYNNAEGLRKTLASVTLQTYRDIEHIIIDAASTDGSVEAIKEYAAKVESGESRVESEGICISAKYGDIEPLKREMVRIAKADMQTSAVMLSNARHYAAVTRAHEAIGRVQEGMEQGLSGELLSMDLQDCLNALGEVTGQITNSEVLANIFSKFCIGK